MVDADELEAVYRRDFRRFLGVATSITGDVDTAYDVVQEAFARALRYRRGFRARGPLPAWLWRTVVNTARTARPRPAVAVEASANGHGGEERGMSVLIRELPERQRLAVFLHYYADLDYATIADVMDISPGTVGATLTQARAALRARIEEVRS